MNFDTEFNPYPTPIIPATMTGRSPSKSWKNHIIPALTEKHKTQMTSK
jgi:hypothetical protein